jgi:integrase
MKPTFILEKPSQSKETRIILSINFNYKKIKFASNEKIEPKFWNDIQQKVRSTHNKAAEYNERLNKLSLDYESAFNHLRRENTPITRDNILRLVKIANNEEPKITVKKITFFEFIDQFISDSELGKRLVKGQRLSPYTIKGYKVTKNHLQEFEKQSKRNITFESLDNNFYDALISFFYNKEIRKGKEKDRKPTDIKTGHTFNSVGKHIKNLKVFAGEAREKGLPVSPELFRKKFKILAEDTDQIALSVDELDRIAAVDLTDNASLDHVRDCFLLASYTGLRFSDLQQLTKSNIIDGNRLRITTQKTGQKVVIPLHRIVLKILEKHKGVPPIPISNQKMNDYIKIIAEKANMNEPVSFAKTRAGSKDEETVPKWKLITAHTARRSFATNLYLAGMDILTIKKMTGHHTEKSFLKYIRVSEEENATKAAQHVFFQ